LAGKWDDYYVISIHTPMCGGDGKHYITERTYIVSIHTFTREVTSYGVRHKSIIIISIHVSTLETTAIICIILHRSTYLFNIIS